jgi:hypothetical protein
MAQQYRVISSPYPGPGIHELSRNYRIALVYYDDRDEISYIEPTAISAIGKSVESLKKDLEKMLLAIETPVIDTHKSSKSP